MNTVSTIRKIFHGIAGRHDMFRLFDRHSQNPDREARRSGVLHAGEWFEIGEAEHDYMFEILPPLWMRGEMFALREYLTGSITSIFFTLSIDGRIRWFHGYCDLSDAASPERMRHAIVERESRPVRGMTREEKLEHIWSSTHDDYRGYADDRWREADRGQRVVVFCGLGRIPLLLEALTDVQIAAKLPVHLRYLLKPMAA